MINELANRIWAHPELHSEAGELRSRLLRSKFIASDTLTAELEAPLIRLLKSAAVLSASSSKDHRQLAYQIATSASELRTDQLDGIPYVLLMVLARLGNFPALAFAQKRFDVDSLRLPTRFVAEALTRAEDNSVALGESALALTDFQYKLWNELNSGAAVGISAPTSAGKSFILQAYARKLLVENRAQNVAILVPTRALINQVSDEVSDWLGQVDGLELVTTPIPRDTALPARAIFVVTQERMQLLQAAHEQLKIDLMLVDEAQSIAEGPRGVLLSSVIEEALERNAGMQLLFAGPNIKDPGGLASLFKLQPRSVSTDEATVSQSIIFADCDPVRTKFANLSLLAGTQRIPLGEVECEQALTDHNSKLVNLALRLGQDGQNLIYALGPAECEEIAIGLSDDETPLSDTALQELSDFAKDAVHPKYQLVRSVLHGVGYHYGYLPALVRKAVEDAFSEGHLRYLVTTSTLLYGVNLPAQNLFLHNPVKGKDQPINSNDFWNLAGRAGRLGKEFSGNIFLIDYGGWLTDPMSGDKDLSVKPSIQTQVADNASELIDYIGDPGRIPDRRISDELENAFVKLVRDRFDGKLADTLDRVGLNPSNPLRQKLESAIEDSIAHTNITKQTLVNSPTVSIHRQQSLYERLVASLKKKGPEYIIPRHPLQAGAYGSYLGVLKRLHDEVMKYSSKDNSHKYVAQIALKWMKGDPLPQIIETSFTYKISQGRNPTIATVIRETLSDIERELRFKYVRLWSCYNAVLELVLQNHGMNDLVGSIPSVPMYLEVGACSPTMVSFMGLGLSRYTATQLRKFARREDMSQPAARSWIQRQDLDSLNLPNASVREIRRMVPSS